MVVGPNTPISNGSLMPSIEAQLDFALSFVDKIQKQGVKSVVVSREANNEFNDYKDAVMELLTFSGNCNSWLVALPLMLNFPFSDNLKTGTRVARLRAGSLARGPGRLTTSSSRSGIPVCRTLSSPTSRRTGSRGSGTGCRCGILTRRSWGGTFGLRCLEGRATPFYPRPRALGSGLKHPPILHVAFVSKVSGHFLLNFLQASMQRSQSNIGRHNAG